MSVSEPSMQNGIGKPVKAIMDGEFANTGINRRTCRDMLIGSGTTGKVSEEGQKGRSGRGTSRYYGLPEPPDTTCGQDTTISLNIFRIKLINFLIILISLIYSTRLIFRLDFKINEIKCFSLLLFPLSAIIIWNEFQPDVQVGISAGFTDIGIKRDRKVHDSEYRRRIKDENQHILWRTRIN
ncbi:MAG: hypothetical protein NC100_08260 [Clostridium sp.]|nr:hypothetical protein [Clostridium sp.]